MSIVKTLIGKNNYLFLINDSSTALENHCKESFIKQININIFDKILDKFLLIVFPDKECICQEFLPDNFKIKNRYCLEYYKLNLKNKLLDTTGLLDSTDYFKTDTHMNFKGLYKVYKETITQFNNLYKQKISILNVNIKNIDSNNLITYGYGDLTWNQNKGNLILANTDDKYYYSDDLFPFYSKLEIKDPLIVQNVHIEIINRSLNNVTKYYLNNIINWDILSKDIIKSEYPECNNNLKILFFYDSFTIQIMPLLMKTFKHCFFSKTHLDYNLVNIIKPDFVLEFRVERFLF
jgi:hypothetical protein